MSADMWPCEKLDAGAEKAKGSFGTPAVLIANGGLCPIHRGHVFMLHQAQARLERAGYVVLAAWLSPSHDTHLEAEWKNTGHPVLSAQFRLRSCELAVRNSPFVSVSSFECSGQPKTLKEVVTACQKAVTDRCGEKLGYGSHVRTFYCCGSDVNRKLRLYKGLDPAHEQGVCIVPRENDDPLMEHPHDLIYIADEAPGEAATFSSSMVLQALRMGDTPFLLRAIPEPAVRLLLAPTAGERAEFGADIDKLGQAEDCTKGTWPMHKLIQRLKAFPEDGEKTPAVLIGQGLVAPVTRGHLAMFWQAKERLERAGYFVLGAWLCPSSDQKAFPEMDKLGQPRLSAQFRLKAAELATRDDELVAISQYALDKVVMDMGEAINSLTNAAHTRFEASLQHMIVRGFNVSGVEYESKYKFSKSLKVCEKQGNVIVPREGEDCFLEKPHQRYYLANSPPGEIAGYTSKKVITAMKSDDSAFVARAVPPAAARYLLTPRADERNEFPAEFEALGVPPVGAFSGAGSEVREKLKGSFQKWIGPNGTISTDDMIRLMQMIDPSWSVKDLSTLLDGTAAPGGDVPIVCDEFLDWVFSGKRK